MENFKKGPDVSDATKVGEPTLVDPKQASAPDMVRAANSSVMCSLAGSNKVGVERVGNGALPAANAAVPRSDAAPGAPAGSTPVAGNASAAAPATAAADPVSGGAASGSPSSATSDSTAVPEMKNDLQPAVSTPPPGATAPPPAQVNDAATASSVLQARNRRPQPPAVRRNSPRRRPIAIRKARRRKRRSIIGRSDGQER